MQKLAQLTRNGLLAATLLTLPLAAQTDSNRTTGDGTTTAPHSDRRDERFNASWLGLLGLIGLAGLRRRAPETVVRSGEGGAKTYSKS